MIGPELPDPPYKSLCWTGKAHSQWWPLWFDGGLCDRMGCLAETETPTSRFCETHRREHGQRLQGQLRAIVRQHYKRHDIPVSPAIAPYLDEGTSP